MTNVYFFCFVVLLFVLEVNIMTENEKVYTEDKEVNVMPTMEMIEYERVAYVKGMEEYLYNLKKMNKVDAKKKSFDNLVRCNIIHENGEFTERYNHSIVILEEKG